MSRFFDVEEALLREARDHPDWLPAGAPPKKRHGRPVPISPEAAAVLLAEEWRQRLKEQQDAQAKMLREYQENLQKIQQQAVAALRAEVQQIQPKPVEPKVETKVLVIKPSKVELVEETMDAAAEKRLKKVEGTTL